jgi:hypothetical protein
VQPILDEYDHIHCYLDNDNAGKVATEYIIGIQQAKAIDESYRYNGCKDLNDYLRGKQLLKWHFHWFKVKNDLKIQIK